MNIIENPLFQLLFNPFIPWNLTAWCVWTFTILYALGAILSCTIMKGDK